MSRLATGNCYSEWFLISLTTTSGDVARGHGKDADLFQKSQIIGLRQAKKRLKVDQELSNSLLKPGGLVMNHHLQVQDADGEKNVKRKQKIVTKQL